MKHYIDKSAITAEIKKRIRMYTTVNACSKKSEERYRIKWHTLMSILSFINNLEVKDVDLEKELESWRHNHFHGRRDKEASGEYLERVSQLDFAKHFFELGLNSSNPIAKENLESFVRQVIDLDIEAGEYYNNIIEEERKENGGGGSDLMINLLCGTVDAKELGIQYVLDKLKAQKGE